MKKVSEKFRVTVLAENTGYQELEGEHGLSLYIEYNDLKVLLDAGKSPLFFVNAKKLGIHLEEIDFAVLSHHHYDHADGFDTFFDNNEAAKLYVREAATEDYYSKHDKEIRYIGPKQGMLEKYKDRIIYVKDDFYPLENGEMFLVAHSMENLSVIGQRAELYKKECLQGNENLVPDDFTHEQTLVIYTQKGLVILNSCSHGGPANIIREVLKYENRFPIYAYVGGFHLSQFPDEDVFEFVKTLKELNIERIITGHCTGEHAYEIIREELGEKAEQMHSGMTIEF